MTYRYRGHLRGDPGGYRHVEKHQAWLARDPIERTKTRPIERFGAEPARLVAIERRAEERVEAAVAFALASPEPEPSDALTNVFAKSGPSRWMQASSSWSPAR